MKHKFFIFSCLISILIEYGLLFIFLYKVLKINLIVSIIVVVVIFLLLLIGVLLGSKSIIQGDIDIDDRPCEEELLEIINKINKLYNKKFELHYISIPVLNPAFCMKDCVYINLSEKKSSNTDKVTYSLISDEIFLPGVVAHELGHAISELTQYTFLATIKPLYIISSYLIMIIQGLIGKQNIFLKMLNYFLIFVYIVITLPYQLFIYPFIRQDEITANSIAAKLGYGENLRAYYKLYSLVNDDNNKLLRAIDFTHPTPELMAKKLSIELKVNKKAVDYFIAKKHLVYVESDTITLQIPDEVTTILNRSIKNPNLKKLTGKNVKTVYPNAFNYCSSIEQLILPNVEDFPIHSLGKLKNLKEVKINDLSILLRIYLRYPDRMFSNKIKKTLIDNNYELN